MNNMKILTVLALFPHYSRRLRPRHRFNPPPVQQNRDLDAQPQISEQRIEPLPEG